MGHIVTVVLNWSFMSQNESTNNSEKVLLKGRVEFPEKPADQLEHSEDAQHARESTKEERNQALESNKDRHSGSAGGHGASIEVILRDTHGHEEMTTSRKHAFTEKDIERYEASKKSIGRNELERLAESGDISASKFVDRMKQAKTGEEQLGIQKEADRWFCRGEFVRISAENADTTENDSNRQRSETNVNTGVLKAIESDAALPADKRQLAQQLQEMRAESKRLGSSTEAIDGYAQNELQQEIDAQTKSVRNGTGDDLQNPILREIIRYEIDDLKRGVGVAHGTVNFVVNTLAGIGNAVRMAGAATFEGTPLVAICPDLYPDHQAREMLHQSLEGTFVTARVLNQLTTTFNPSSPLYKIEYDPQGSAITRELIQKLPAQIGQELNNFVHADPEAQATVATEVLLNIVTLIETGGLGTAAKAGEIGQLGTIAKYSEETAALSELAQASKIATGAESLTAASTVAVVALKTLEKQAGVFTALAEKTPSLKPLAEKFKDCLTELNEATRLNPAHSYAGVGTVKGDGIVDLIQNAGQQIKISAEGVGEHFEDYANFMVKKGEGGGFRKGDKPRKVPKGEIAWEVSVADTKLTEELFESGRAVWRKAGNHVRLQRLDQGDGRTPFDWEAIGEVLSEDVPRQSDHFSCVNLVGSALSGGRFSEAQLIEKFGVSAAMKEIANYIGWKFENVTPGFEMEEIAAKCERGPWGAKLFDGEAHHAVIVQFRSKVTSRLRIHDSFEGTKYEMTIEEFKARWNGDCMFQ